MDSVKLYLIEQHETKISEMEQKIKDLEAKVIAMEKVKELESNINDSRKPNAYALYLKQNKDKIKAAYPGMTLLRAALMYKKFNVCK